MFSNSLVALSALAATLASASPYFGPRWSISQYESGCSPGACTYKFSIASDTPSFSGSCTGTSVQPNFAACTLGQGQSGSLAAKLDDFQDPSGDQTLVVSFKNTYQADENTVRTDNYTLHVHDKVLGYNHPTGWFLAPDEVTSVA